MTNSNSPSGSPRRWIGYVRVSTSEQTDSGLGLAAQRKAIEAYVEGIGGELVAVVADEGLSAATLERAGLLEALNRLLAGEADGLIASKLDRISRSVADTADLLEWSEQADKTIAALDVGLDTSSASGRLVASVMAAVASWERETIGQRTKDALAAKRQAGEAISRPTVPADVADRIRVMRESGLTFQAIADQLNADQVPTARGAAQWRPSAIQRSLGYQRPRKARRRDSLPAPARRKRSKA